jgi:hypothetical protein
VNALDALLMTFNSLNTLHCEYARRAHPRIILNGGQRQYYRHTIGRLHHAKQRACLDQLRQS